MNGHNEVGDRDRHAVPCFHDPLRPSDAGLKETALVDESTEPALALGGSFFLGQSQP